MNQSFLAMGGIACVLDSNIESFFDIFDISCKSCGVIKSKDVKRGEFWDFSHRLDLVSDHFDSSNYFRDNPVHMEKVKALIPGKSGFGMSRDKGLNSVPFEGPPTRMTPFIMFSAKI